MKSECFEKERLLAYATKLLEPAEEAKVDAHLAGGCETCNAVVWEYRALDSVLDEWKPAQPSPWFDARLRTALASGRPARTAGGFLGFDRARWSRWLTPALAAALVVVVSVVAVRVRRTGHPGTGAGNTIAQQGPAQAVNPPSKGGGEVQGPQAVQPGSEEPRATNAAQAVDDDEMLTNFDVLSELPAPQSSDKVEN